MSEWGSFTTEFIACPECFHAVGEAFKAYRGRGTIEPNSVGPNGRIYAGYCSGLYAGEERFSFDFPMRDEIEKRICHPLRIAVLCAHEESSGILTYEPDEEREP